MSYSVLYEPVIPVEDYHGIRHDVGLREAFLQAHTYRDILGDTPLERYALLRLMVAFAMDMLHPKNRDERRQLFEQGSFDEAVFDNYVAMCEQEAPRFDLLDPEHPFMQSKYDAVLDAKMEKPVAELFQHFPSGNNHMLFDHRYSIDHIVSLPKAFRGLITTYLFCFAVGGQGIPSSINSVQPLYVTVLGENLFETIIINMLAKKETGALPYGVGEVPWRKPCHVEPKKQIPSVSLLEGLTWMPRRITLIADSVLNIERIYSQAGYNFNTFQCQIWRDPFVPYTKQKDQYKPIIPQLGRAIWRDFGSLVSGAEAQPLNIALLDHIPEVWERNVIISLRIVGLVVSNNAKYDLWYEDEISLPKKLFLSSQYGDMFRDDIDCIEKMQESISTIINKKMQESNNSIIIDEHKRHETAQSKTKKVSWLTVYAQQEFLQYMRDGMLGEIMDHIFVNNDYSIHAEFFFDKMRSAIRLVIENNMKRTGMDMRNILRNQYIERDIMNELYKIKKQRMSNYAE